MDLPSEISDILTKTANMAIADKTKSTYSTALNNVRKCEEEVRENLNFPWDNRKTLIFIGWLIKRDVQSCTIRSYLSGVQKAHVACGFKGLDQDSPLIREVLLGHKNKHAQGKVNNKRAKRLPATVNVLRFLKTKIRMSNMKDHDKITAWAACTICFYGALRSSEALSRYENFFDPSLTLCKKDVTLCTDGDVESLHLNIKHSKTNKSGIDETVVIYATNSDTCPIRAAKKLLLLNRNVPSDYPFFSLESGKPLAQRRFNSLLSELTSDQIKGGSISSHSFRIGITSLLDKKGFSDSELKKVGRWSSRAFKVYIRLSRTNRAEMAKECSKL